MKDVVTAARRRPRVLVTGFGAFPGAPTNPTLDMLRSLESEAVEGVDLSLAQLPVTFAGVAPALRLAAGCRPDIILLLGLATRRTILNVETLARNVAGSVTPDADGVVPSCSTLVQHAPARHVATWPAETVLEALRDAGHCATLSDDAGDYVCNAALFHALDDPLAPMIGFLHVPPVRDDMPSRSIGTLTGAARIVIGALAAAFHRRATYSAANAG